MSKYQADMSETKEDKIRLYDMLKRDLGDAIKGVKKAKTVSLDKSEQQKVIDDSIKQMTIAKLAIRQIMAEYYTITEPITLKSGKKTTKPKHHDEITNDDIMNIIRQLVKSEEKILEAKKEKVEDSVYINFLRRYLPKMATKQDIEVWILHNVDFAAFKDRKHAIGYVMKHFGKNARGKDVGEVLKDWDN